jgi:hypothetical protein
VGLGGGAVARGVRCDGPTLSSPLLGYNAFSRWTADQSEPETWENAGETPRLTSGGKHYGHLEIDINRDHRKDRTACLTLTPVHLFPVLDADLHLVKTERRTYDDRTVIDIASNGAPRGA